MSHTTPNGVPVLHADHGLVRQHLVVIDQHLRDWDGQFMLALIPIPDGVPSLPSALYGPACGDDPVPENQVQYVVRGERRGPSRVVDRLLRDVRSMVVVCGQGRHGAVIYTAYGGQVIAPREWWDIGLRPLEAIEAARFWAEHALSWRKP